MTHGSIFVKFSGNISIVSYIIYYCCSLVLCFSFNQMARLRFIYMDGFKI